MGSPDAYFPNVRIRYCDHGAEMHKSIRFARVVGDVGREGLTTKRFGGFLGDSKSKLAGIGCETIQQVLESHDSTDSHIERDGEVLRYSRKHGHALADIIQSGQGDASYLSSRRRRHSELRATGGGLRQARPLHDNGRLRAAMALLVMNPRIHSVVELRPAHAYHQLYLLCLGGRTKHYSVLLPECDEAIAHSDSSTILAHKNGSFEVNIASLERALSDGQTSCGLPIVFRAVNCRVSEEWVVRPALGAVSSLRSAYVTRSTCRPEASL